MKVMQSLLIVVSDNNGRTLIANLSLSRINNFTSLKKMNGPNKFVRC